jgi:hypothetical protein
VNKNLNLIKIAQIASNQTPYWLARINRHENWKGDLPCLNPRAWLGSCLGERSRWRQIGPVEVCNVTARAKYSNTQYRTPQFEQARMGMASMATFKYPVWTGTHGYGFYGHIPDIEEIMLNAAAFTNECTLGVGD